MPDRRGRSARTRGVRARESLSPQGRGALTGREMSADNASRAATGAKNSQEEAGGDVSGARKRHGEVGGPPWPCAWMSFHEKAPGSQRGIVIFSAWDADQEPGAPQPTGFSISTWAASTAPAKDCERSSSCSK